MRTMPRADTIWWSNALAGLRGARQHPADWEGYLCWLDWTAERVDGYIDAHHVTTSKAHRKIVRKFAIACRRIADFSLLRHPGGLAQIVRVHKRAVGLVAKCAS